MYLKSLNLKGFKSFADRTVMRFEPGLAAVVGPNGSGKSNISDAVLWVLGERNAKNLRGQSMEDVIFSGSSARKPVGVAEVELLLDNSDATLPVDFDEVSIGRRMYRSGESEYLINGSVVRRMDVLDILHDSGLGTGTNSIISQGNLDSVLASKPEDRRALIEEAAGILKHKERKMKSERKLLRMDNHLARINDITAEVERQLKPLERKAKRALAYQDLAAELAELKLSVAVDDLRVLRSTWDRTLSREEELDRRSDEAREVLDASEAHLDELQRQLQVRGETESTLSGNHRRIQTAYERLNSTLMLLREKRRSALHELERLSRSSEENSLQYKRAQGELEQAMGQLRESEEQRRVAEDLLASLEADYAERVEKRNALRKTVETMTAEQRAYTHRRETIQATQEALRENMSESRARAQVIEAHLQDTSSRLARAEEEAALARESADGTAADYERVQEEEACARGKLNETLVERDRLRREVDRCRDDHARISAERGALEELERARSSSNPALSWLMEHKSELQEAFLPFAHAVKAPASLEALVESLLGDDLSALLVADDTTAAAIVKALLDAEVTGEVAFVFEEKDFFAPTVPSRYPRLCDQLDIDPRYRGGVEVLLGDIYLADSYGEALEAHRSQEWPVCFASPDGCIVNANGKIVISRMSETEKADSILARRRALEDLREREAEAAIVYEQVQAQSLETENRLHDLQAETLKLSESLAHLKGRRESTLQDREKSQQALDALVVERDRLLEEQEKNQGLLDKAQPDSDDLDKEFIAIQVAFEENQGRLSDLEKTLTPVQKTILDLSEKISDARLDVARLSERSAYAERMVASRKQEIDAASRSLDEAHSRMQMATLASHRVDPLLHVLGSLADSARILAARLEEETNAALTHSHDLHRLIAEATRRSRESRDRFDALIADLSSLRVEKGRLEIQVEAAIKVITEDCATSLERALECPELEERNEVIERMERLQRRIKNMGTINPDAAREFEEVNERYVYLSAQLKDMKLARQSLSRIVKVIDERMKDDFIDTFNRVNDNFSEIFSTLFPGGQAHLSLVDPDDLENTGVDVSAQPVGKRIKKMSLLSGGEKSMTAMALLFAVYRIRQTPFYILDEVEAALDDSNLRRLMAYLETIRHKTQFIMITHQRRTMESADILYGVSMQADGVTKVLSQKLEQAISQGE